METTTRLCGAGYKVMTATMLVNDNSPNEIVGIGVLCIRTAMMRSQASVAFGRPRTNVWERYGIKLDAKLKSTSL